MDTKKSSRLLTAATLARLGSQSRAQLEVWRLAITETQEQIASAQEAAGSKGKTEKWLEAVEKEIRGTGTISLAERERGKRMG